MADIRLRNVYTGHDDDYAQREFDAEWEGYLRRQAQAGEPGPGEEIPTPAPTVKPEPTPAAPATPAATAAEPAAPEQPSAIITGITTGATALGAGFHNVAEGMRKLLEFTPVPEEASFGEGAALAFKAKLDATKHVLIDGLMQMGFAPVTGGFAGIGQALENAAPDLAKSELFQGGPGGPAFTVRHLAAGAPDVRTIPPEQYQAMQQPMSVREAFEVIVPQLAPMALPHAVKAGKAVAGRVQEVAPVLKGQRGAVEGEPPPPEGPRPPATPETPRAEGEAPGGGPRGAPGMAESRLNVEYIATAEDTKRLMTAISTRIGETEPVAGTRERVTHAETIARAREWPLEKLLAVVPEDVRLGDLTPVKHSARDHYTAAAEHLMDLSRRMESGDVTAEAEFWPAQAVAVKLAELAGMATETGRALEAQKIMAAGGRVAPFTPEQLLDLSQKMRSGMGNPSARTAAARLAALPTAAQRRSYLQNLGAMLRTGKDAAHSLWINSLLTNPVTHAANVTGTGLMQAWNLPEHYTAEIVNRLFFRDAEGVQRGETAAMVKAIPEGITDAIRLMGKALKLETKGKDAVQLSAVEADLLGTGKMEIGDQHLPAVLRIPTIALGIEDAGGKAIAYRMSLKALAHREAMAEGKTGKAYADRMTELEAHPTASMIAEATDQAMLQTLNRELGPYGQAFMKLANLPGGRLVMPFIRTPTNITKYIVHRAPILAQLSSQNRADILAGGALRDKAIARQVLGGAVSAVIAWEVANGNITGGGERDRSLRSIEKEERPPYSIKVGDTWSAYSRLDPLGGIVGAVADYVEMASRIPTQDEWDEWGAYGATLGLAVGNVMINKTYMRGLSDTLDAMKDPTRDAGKVASGFARSLVPAGVRAVTRQADDMIVRDARTLVDSIKSGIPGLSGDVPPARNQITGEPVKYPPGWGPDFLSPIYITEKKNDPVFKAILDNRISLPPPPRWVHGSQKPTEGPMLEEPKRPALKLTPVQYDDWLVAMTQKGPRTLYADLHTYVTSQKYADASPQGRELQIKAIYGSHRDRGWLMVLQAWPELVADLRAHDETAINKLRPRTDPRSPLYRAGPKQPSGLGGMLEQLVR